MWPAHFAARKPIRQPNLHTPLSCRGRCSSAKTRIGLNKGAGPRNICTANLHCRQVRHGGRPPVLVQAPCWARRWPLPNLEAGPWPAHWQNHRTGTPSPSATPYHRTPPRASALLHITPSSPAMHSPHSLHQPPTAQHLQTSAAGRPRSSPNMPPPGPHCRYDPTVSSRVASCWEAANPWSCNIGYPVNRH